MSLKTMLETIKNNLNATMNYIDYVHVCIIFLVSNVKNIIKVKHNLLLNGIHYLIT